MNRLSCLGVAGLACTILLTAVAPAKALRIAVPVSNPTQQAMTSEVIIVGKVTEVEKEMAQATQFPGQPEKVSYHIGVIKINEGLLGAKGLTTIRVGFLPVPKFDGPVGTPRGPATRPIGRPFPAQQATLSAGQEGCFFLNKHYDGDFYVMQQFSLPLDKKVADFDKQLEAVKKVLKTIEDPMSGLKAKDVADRQMAAHVMIQKYRQYPPNATKQPKQEDISAEQSKLILLIMSEMEWNKFDPKTGVSLPNMFGMLGIQQGQNGFSPPQPQPNQPFDPNSYGQYVQKWLKDNAGKYRIQKWVASK
jgi:hypothetical protein